MGQRKAMLRNPQVAFIGLLTDALIDKALIEVMSSCALRSLSAWVNLSSNSRLCASACPTCAFHAAWGQSLCLLTRDSKLKIQCVYATDKAQGTCHRQDTCDMRDACCRRGTYHRRHTCHKQGTCHRRGMCRRWDMCNRQSLCSRCSMQYAPEAAQRAASPDKQNDHCMSGDAQQHAGEDPHTIIESFVYAERGSTHDSM